MIHDLGELFGGDIAMPYAKANPEARKHAKAFEAENHKYLGKFFGAQEEHFRSLSDEILDAQSDESIIAKLADYMEVTHYKKYVQAYRESDMELVRDKLSSMIDNLSDPIAKEELRTIISGWMEDFPKMKPLNESL